MGFRHVSEVLAAGVELRMQGFGRLGYFYSQAMLIQPFPYLLHLQVNDLLHLLNCQWREDDDLVDAVEKFWSEGVF